MSRKMIPSGKFVPVFVFAFFVLFGVGCDNAPEANRSADRDEPLPLVPAGEQVVKLAGDFQFTEGPAADAQGNIYFSDIPTSKTHRWSVHGELSLVRQNTGGANGLYIDPQARLLVCEGGNRMLTRIDPISDEGKRTVLADQFEGKRLNSPNDLWRHPNGGIYFTDPRYGNRDGMEQDGEHVYYLSADGTLIRVIEDMVRPNGLIGTPDGKTLYVTDPGAGQTWQYEIAPDGRLINKRLFVQAGSDGMTIDTQGRVYLTTKTVEVYSPEGEKVADIAVPEKPSNVCFSGTDRTILFITARTSIYALRLNAQGCGK